MINNDECIPFKPRCMWWVFKNESDARKAKNFPIHMPKLMIV